MARLFVFVDDEQGEEKLGSLETGSAIKQKLLSVEQATFLEEWKTVSARYRSRLIPTKHSSRGLGNRRIDLTIFPLTSALREEIAGGRFAVW